MSVDEAYSRFERAYTFCLEDLPRVLAARRRDRGDPLPRWQELGAAAVEFLLNTPASEGEVVAFQLAGVLPLTRARIEYPRLVAPGAARSLAHTAVEGKDFFPLLGTGGVAMWAPADQSALGRLLSGYMRRAASSPQPRPMRLLVPMDVFPGCSTAGLIKDLFWHPLLGERWAPLVREQAFVHQELQMVSTGSGGPAHVCRGLLIATLSPSLPPAVPKVLSVAEPLITARAGHSFFVDCPTLQAPMALNVAEAAGALLRARVGPCMRSPASSPELPRTRFEVFLPVGQATELDLTLLIRNLRLNHLPAGSLVGSRQLYSDNSALLVDLTAPAAIHAVWHLCEEAIFITPRLVTIRAASTPEQWRPVLDQILTADASCCVLKVRWRSSRHGGRPWVTPTATPQQLAVVRRSGNAAAARGSSGASAMTTLTVEGSLGYDPPAVVRSLMAVIRDRTGVALAEAPQEGEPGSGTWYRLADRDPSAHPGRVRLQLTTLEEARKIIQEVHGRAVQLGTDLISISIANDEVERQQGNEQRGRAGQGPAPARVAGQPAGRQSA